MATVVLDKINKVYDNGFHAVIDLSLEIDDGEFLVLVGPSGCGKTTALRMVAGLEDITSGELLINGNRMNDLAPRDRDIAMVFQSYALYPHLTVGENIGFGLKLRRTPKEQITQRVGHAARLLGLEDLLDRRPKQLSGGQRQRVAMGRAIVREPQAFLMDEPLSNLDAKLRGQMRSEIAHLQRELKVTTIYVTHDQIEAMTMGDRVAVMRKGVLQQVAGPQALYDRPANLFVAGFIGSPPMNLAEATVELSGDDVLLALGEQRLRLDPALVAERPTLRAYNGRAVAMGIRSEDMEDAATKTGAPADQRLTSKVMITEALGSELVVHFDLAGARPVSSEAAQELSEDRGIADLGEVVHTVGAKFVASFSPRSRVRPGDEVEVVVDTTRLYLFDLGSGLAIW